MLEEIMQKFKKLNFVPHSYPNPIGMVDSEQRALAWCAIQAGAEHDWLETGSFYGGSTCLLGLTRQALGKEGTVFSVDRWRFDGEFDKNVSKAKLDNVIKKIDCDSIDLPKLYPGNELSFVFIDGWHSFKGAYTDFLNINNYLCKGGYVLFHDVGTPDEATLKNDYKRAVKNFDSHMSEVLPCNDVHKQTYRLDEVGAYIVFEHNFEVVYHPYCAKPNAVFALKKL